MVVQFKSQASVASPPWSAQASALTSPFGTGPEIYEPDLDPVTDNNFTFTYTPGQAWPNGACNITPHAVYGGSSEKCLEWTFPDIYGCIKSITLGAWPYEHPTLTYERLPNANGSFGNKVVTVKRRPDNCTDTVTVQLFFPNQDAAVNHPGSGTGVTPNWYYYWKQTGATWGTPYWDSVGLVNAGISFSSPYPPGSLSGNWVGYISHGANDSIVIPAGPRKNQTMTGIDYFGYACRHEQRHAVKMNQWSGWMDVWRDGDAWITPTDQDHDLLPDSTEADLGPEAGGPYDKAKRITYPQDDMPDGHRYIFYTQQDWIPGSANSEDWSKPGKQSNQ